METRRKTPRRSVSWDAVRKTAREDRGFEPRPPHWWDASVLTTAPSLLPLHSSIHHTFSP